VEPLRWALMEASSLNIHQVSFTSSLANTAIDAAERELHVRYGPFAELPGLEASTFEPPTGVFLVATNSLGVVGGVGVRGITPHIGEVKRLWVHDEARRQGVASSLMSAVEEASCDLGFSMLVLETGPLQPEAVSLYHSLGFDQVDELPVSVSTHHEAIRFTKQIRA